MPDILPHVLAAILYAGLAVHFWRTRWRGPVLDHPPGKLSALERGVLLLALVAHAASLKAEIFGGGQMRFGFAIALSVMLWLAITLYWIESFYARMDGLQILGLPFASIAAMLAYSLFTLAALHSLLMAGAERELHRGRVTPFFAGLPPLLTMEALLFRLLEVGFVLLTATVVTGVFFSEAVFGRALTLDHKTVFAILSWLIFAALLAGRHLRGWRGRIALRWTLAGFASLLLAYVGSRFVVEVLLGRG